jgi:hypothetical protein
MTAMKKNRFPGLVSTALAGLCLSAVTGAELANNGFEADAPAEVGYSALVPASWTGSGVGTKYVAKNTLLSPDNKAPSGERYFLAHVTPGLHCAISQELPALNWSSLSVGDTLTISASTTYRADVPGTAQTHFWLNPSDSSGLNSPPMDVTLDAAPGEWKRRTWSYVITQTMLSHAAAKNWGAVEIGVGIVWKNGKDANQQVAFDDVTVTHTPAPKLASTSSGGPDFNRDIRPILSENCFLCHGQDPEHRGGDLRLDIREEAVAVRDGIAAIVPGDPKNSDIIKRIISKDPDMVMPPPKAHMPAMKPEQLALLEKWIENGAEYQPHWSFVAPKKKESPTANPVDHFINRSLKEKKLTAAPVADDNTLVRRIHLDLTGLPPSPQDINAFLNENASDRWEKLIDRLMGSTQFAERMAMPWLDAARYSDTHGYSIDDHRDMWAWRDWVINAFLKNQPYDQFITEQVAGDLVPNATPDQIAATAFLRNSMNTHEGGTIAEEYRVNYTLDKVDAVSTSILGLTMKCAQCHDHKYDPISQKEFFSMYAFFNTSSEPGLGATNANTQPVMEYKSPLGDGGMAQLKSRISELEHFKANPPPDLVEFIKQQGKSLEQELAKTVGEEINVLKRDLDRGHTSLMVMDHKPELRKTHILIRGAYDQYGEEVSPGVLSVLPPLEASANPTRLDLAKWITRPDHPLTARVAINRTWQMVFGRGLVETAGDFGNQGSWPTHPELLDWLAVDLVENGWNLRHSLKTILTSETYRRSAASTPEHLEKDPRNELLARSPRTRLPAEIIRDQALAVSGLLNPAIGGPGVHPPQPDLWREISHFGYEGNPFTAQIFIPGLGDSVYRRSLYTFWKRTSPPPVLAIFDAPTRETCAVVRGATNTPLQALVVMNEPQFVEAGVALGKRMIAEGGPSATSRLTHGFQLTTGREPTTSEMEVLEKSLARHLDRFTANQDDAKVLAGTPEEAAYAILGSTLINLDEFINRP